MRIGEEVRYIQQRAARADARVVTLGPLILFSTDTGDAWLLDPADHFAARVARDGSPEPIQILETETSFTIAWKGHYQIEGDAFIYIDRESSRIVTIVGYPTDRIAEMS